MQTLKSLIAGLALSAVFVLSAFAAPVEISLAPNTSYYVDSFDYTSSEANLTVTGWSNKSSYNNSIVKDKIGRWKDYGLGVEALNSPHHAVDNAYNDYDGLLFSFDKIVEVSGLGIGWYQNDADVSLLAYTGKDPFGGSLSGTWASLLDNGWSVVGNYDRNSTGNFAVNEGTPAVTAQYWLVGAYNSVFGALNTQTYYRSTWPTNNTDYFKLNSITIEAVRPDNPPVDVAESGSLILVLLGLAGLCIVRRRTV